MRLRVGLWMALALIIGTVFAQPVDPRTFPAQKLTQVPLLDGVVEEEEWREAFMVERFWSPVRQSWGTPNTRAYIGYTHDAIYVAFLCEDPNPESILAQETKRGGNLENDDTVAVLIDPQARNLEPYTFTVNARGTQSEDIPAGTTENIRWRGDWQAKARISETGWSAEMRIPFQSLRYAANQRQFGIILERYLPRQNEIHTFPNMGAFYSTRRQALWTGLEPPPPRYPIILLPYFTGDSTSGSTTSRSGLDVRYMAGDPLTAVFTLRPDFRNIAGDVAKVDFSYTEKLLEEQRPFFQEGRDYMPPRAMFYSLRIQDLTTGGKAFGALGDWRYGFLLGEYDHTNGRTRQVGVGRVRYQFAERSFVNLHTVRLQGDVRETNLGFSLDTSQIDGEGEVRFAATLFRLEGDRDGTFQQYTLTRNARERLPNYLLQYTDIEPNYRPQLGFIPEFGYRALRFGILWFDRPESGTLLYNEARLELSSRKNYGGSLLDEGGTFTYQWLFRSQNRLTLGVSYLNRPPNIDRTLNLAYGWNVLDLYRSGELFVSGGEQNGGRSLYTSLSQSLEVAPRLRLRLELETLTIAYSDPELPDDSARQLIFTLNYEIDPERAIGGRLVLNRLEFGGEREETRNFYLTYLQRVRQGFDIYLIYGLPNASRTQNRFAVKVMTPIEIL